MEPVPQPSIFHFETIEKGFDFVQEYGWWLLGGLVVSTYCWFKLLQPLLAYWRQWRDDAEYHKDPDKSLAETQRVREARERLQRALEERSRQHKIEEEQRLARKKIELQERLTKSLKERGVHTLADDYLPLTGAGTSGGYRPPKKSKCAGGGCGG